MKLGVSFSDNLILEKKVSHAHFSHGRAAWWLGSGRALIFSTILCVSFFILIFKLFSLTIIHGHEFRVLADGNRTREIILHAPRGLLFDRYGLPLVENKPGPHNTFTRNYLYPNALAHFVGYTSEITADELKDDYYAFRNYRMGDRIGRIGAEAYFEERLRGRDGRELVEIDATGKEVRVLGVDQPMQGENIMLSVDAKLADAAASAFPAGEKGAIIISSPKTGEILGLFSSPSFSPNDLSESLLRDPDRPMFDRAIGGIYPPGSTFKIVVGVGALEERAITKDTTYEDNGAITLGPFSFPNWYFLQYGKTEGMMNIVRAYARSNDIFFYKTGQALGITKLAAWARKVGIGKPLGIELPGEASGLMPDPAWKNLNFVSKEDREARNNLWFTGDTYHVSIGQGYVLATPIQVNAWTNVIANGGKLCRPTILKTKECKDLGILKETIDTVTEGMREACATGGTGWPLFNYTVSRRRIPSAARDPQTMQKDSSVAGLLRNDMDQVSIPIACKTGTAEFGDPKNRTHAWFTSFAPLQPAFVNGTMGDTITGEPELSVTVLVEGAGQGSDIAAPVAKKIYDAWFSR